MAKHKRHTGYTGWRARRSGWVRYGVAVFLVGFLGLAALSFAGAATYAVNKEAESGVIAGKAMNSSAAGASGSTAVKFGASVPQGTVYWQDAPASPVGRSAPLQNWESSPWNIVNGTMSVVADAEKGKAISFNITGGSSSKQRVEGTIPHRPGIGRTEYWGFDLKLNSGANNKYSGWQCIMQLKSNNEGNPSFELGLDSGKLYAMSNRIGQPNQKVFLANAPIERWSRIVIKFYITKDTNSRVAAWQDGVQSMQEISWVSGDNTGETGGGRGGLIYNNASGGYYKFGIYRGPNNNFPLNVRYANMKFGSTYDIVAQ